MNSTADGLMQDMHIPCGNRQRVEMKATIAALNDTTMLMSQTTRLIQADIQRAANEPCLVPAAVFAGVVAAAWIVVRLFAAA